MSVRLTAYATAVAGVACVALGLVHANPPVLAQAPAGSAKAIYDQIKSFALDGGSADVNGLLLKRDRVEMTFTGTFYFGSAVSGTPTSAVFVGRGTMRAEPPAIAFERENLIRLIGADVLESDFRTAVLRFTDETFQTIGAARHDDAATPPNVKQVASEFDARFARETGANLAARMAVAIANREPGVFAIQFDGGRRGRFSYVLDPAGRMPVANFGLNAGEKGIVFQQHPAFSFTEVWMAFYGLDDYEKGTAQYSDAHDALDVTHYAINMDVRGVPRVKLIVRIDFTPLKPDVRALAFKVGESLPQSQNIRLDNQLRMKRARMGGRDADWVQEDWEGGFTIFLPAALPEGQSASLEVELEGVALQVLGAFPECFYPYSNVTWLPRHGDLDRATFDMTFRHRAREKVAAVGTRVSEAPDPDDAAAMITRYQFDHPVPFATFALGPWDRRSKEVTFEAGGRAIRLEFNSVPARVLVNTTMNAVNHDMILGELDNAVRYFAAMFGPYPYETFGAAFHPFGFGQGFPTLLMIPPATRVGGGINATVYGFFAHETAHQWWGNIVAWRSYRDQWLSEGFAEYSGMLFGAKRDQDPNRAMNFMMVRMLEQLRGVPMTAQGAGKGRLNDVGPLVLGLRLDSTRTRGAYQALIYTKGALVLRMLHFLLSHPTTGDDAAFVAMMTDFVNQYRNKAARTEDFWRVANAHFARTPIAQKFGLQNLDWFFRQWVYDTGWPSYALEYELKPQPDGAFLLSGTIKQEGVGPDWSMVLPLVLSFDGNQVARTTIRAAGPSASFELRVPAKPRKVELDPSGWVLADRKTVRGR